MKYKMNLGSSTLIVDVPHPLSVLRELDQMFSHAQTTESAAHRRPKPPRYDLIGGVKITPAPQQTAKRAQQPVIVITSDGVTTTATRRIGKTIQAIATAKCNPGDTFDFDEGAHIAFERLCGRDPFQETLESQATPEKPESTATPEAYNGRMICAESPYPWWTVGKIYKVVDGRITANNGVVYPPRSLAPYRNAEDARHAGSTGIREGGPRHNRRNLFLPVDTEGRLLV